MTTTAARTTNADPVLCPEGHTVRVHDAFVGYCALCDCYDGAEDAGPQLYGHGKTPAEAIDAFLECEEERSEVEWWPTSLDMLVRAESRATKGWRVIDGVYGPAPIPTAPQVIDLYAALVASLRAG